MSYISPVPLIIFEEPVGFDFFYTIFTKSVISENINQSRLKEQKQNKRVCNFTKLFGFVFINTLKVVFFRQWMDSIWSKHIKLVKFSRESNLCVWIVSPVCQPLHHHDPPSFSWSFNDNYNVCLWPYIHLLSLMAPFTLRTI